jgi:ATP-dependent DNA ligase
MKIIRPRIYVGGALNGEWIASLKIDGVRCIFKDGLAFSRNGMVLNNVPTDHSLRDAEFFVGDFDTTSSIVRSSEAIEARVEDLYSLNPLDDRLYIETLNSPTEEDIQKIFESVWPKHEGVVLRQGDNWLKVKNEETWDVRVTGVKEGKGKNAGKLGALLTERGSVGTGFTDIQRAEYYSDEIVGTTIEVSCMSLTKNGMFRHPRFVRLRHDK